MRLPFFLFVLLLLPSAAHAAGYQVSVTFSGCTPGQQNELREALEATSHNVSTVLARLQQDGLEDYLTAWFGSGKRDTVRRTLQAIRDRLDMPGTLVFSCEERNCDSDLMGYTDSNRISVCPDFFESKADEGYDSRAGTLVHELSHIAAETEDEVYGAGDARRLAHEHPEQAVNNADNYQYFVEAVTGHDTPYGKQGWRPQDSCQWAMDGECDHPGTGTGACPAETDTIDCQASAARLKEVGAKSPTFGPANLKDTCSTALNGRCEDPGSCSPGTDYTDCLTGHTSGKNRRN